MAATRLRDVSVGSVVKLNENRSPVEFYVAKHDYESGLNGNGRTLLVRKNHHSKRACVSSNHVGSYSASDIDAWLNSTYKSLLDAEIQNVLGTNIYSSKSLGSKPSALSRDIFLLSIKELSHAPNTGLVEGSKLPNSDTLQVVYYGSSKTAQWTRTMAKDVYSYFHILWADGTVHCVYGTSSGGIRPAFTVPGSLYVLDDGSVSTNAPPEITSSIVSGSSIGIKNDAVSISYSVDDVDDTDVSVREHLDGTLLNTRESVVVGQTYTIEISGKDYQRVLNGEHVISVVANDGVADSEPYEIRFTKKVTSASITLRNALEADDQIQVAVMTLVGSIPSDADVTVLLTNNGNDTNPVWEDATAAILARENYVFLNQTATNGFAFNFQVTVSRGESDTPGYLASLGGAFQ